MLSYLNPLLVTEEKFHERKAVIAFYVDIDEEKYTSVPKNVTLCNCHIVHIYDKC